MRPEPPVGVAAEHQAAAGGTSEVVAARCSNFQAMAPVSAEMACTAPTWSVPGAISLRTASAYSSSGKVSELSTTIIRPQVLRSGMYIMLVSGL